MKNLLLIALLILTGCAHANKTEEPLNKSLLDRQQGFLYAQTSIELDSKPYNLAIYIHNIKITKWKYNIEGDTYLYLLDKNSIVNSLYLGSLGFIVENVDDHKPLELTLEDINNDGQNHELIITQYASSNGFYLRIVGYSLKRKTLKFLLGNKKGGPFCDFDDAPKVSKKGYLNLHGYDNAEGKWFVEQYLWDKESEVFKFIRHIDK